MLGNLGAATLGPKVDAVVSLCRVGASEITVSGDHVEVWLTDTPGTNANLAYTLDQAARLVLALREEGRKVLLHCAIGRSRTPAVAARYAVVARKADAAEALRATTAAVDGHSGNPELAAAVLALSGNAPTSSPTKEDTRP